MKMTKQKDKTLVQVQHQCSVSHCVRNRSFSRIIHHRCIREAVVLFLCRNFACNLASFCQMNGIIFISFHETAESQVFIFAPVCLFGFCFFISELAGLFLRSVSLSWALSPYFELSRLDGFSASFASRLWKENLREGNAAMQCDLRFAAMFYIGICQYSEVTQFRVSTAIEESTSSFMMFQMVIFLFI